MTLFDACCLASTLLVGLALLLILRERHDPSVRAWVTWMVPAAACASVLTLLVGVSRLT